MKKICCTNYNIYLNDWDSLTAFIQAGNYSSIFTIVDENTEIACLPTLKSAVDRELEVIEIKSGERYKELDTCQDLWEELVRIGADRHALCINLGGGVIGDMGGFVAATFMRGMDFIQIPTTLLSQVDASVGGKLGIDFHSYKNLIGLIKNPGAVFIFTEFLQSLPYRQLLSGFAEVLKHGLIADAAIFYKLSNIINLESVEWTPIIYESVLIKQNITDLDPTEKGLRKVLNFGHTLGHAVESYNLSDENGLLHGEAIAIGMIMETHLSQQLGYITKEECDDIKEVLLRLYGHHPDKIPSIEVLMQKMGMDKKNKGGDILFSLLQNIGEGNYDQLVSRDQIVAAVEYYKN